MIMTETRMTARTTYEAESDPYFQWLCRMIDIPARKPYLKLAKELHGLIFLPQSAVETDANRANDGLQLRVDFMERYGARGSSANRGPCTMLEFLIGLAKRMEFIMDEEGNQLNTSHYFWQMIKNLRLIRMDDERFDSGNGEFFVQEAVDRVLFRTYEKDGSGGLFPLRHPNGDQRTVEIWYQMNQGLVEFSEFEIV